MPGLDQTGPMGQGPMTGRSVGRCTNYGAGRRNQPRAAEQNPEESNLMGSLGFGRGRGGFAREMERGMGREMGLQNRFRGG